MEPRVRPRDESGQSLVEVMLALILFALVIVTVDSSITVIQERNLQVTNSTQALDTLQAVQEAITTDLHAAQTWTTPSLPTSMPGSPVTASWSASGGCGLSFTALLKNATATITICLNTTTHILTVSCAGGASLACPGKSSASVTQAQAANIDSSSSFTFTTAETSSTVNSVTTNTFYFTDVAANLILDSPRVGAPRTSQTILDSPDVEIYNSEYACQQALQGTDVTGSC